MAIHHRNSTRLKAMGLLPRNKVMDHHRRKAIRESYPPLSSQAFANLEPGRKAIQAIHLLKEDRPHNQATEAMARQHRSSRRDRTVEVISRYTGFLHKRGMNRLTVVQDTTSCGLRLWAACTGRTAIRRATR